MTDVATFERHPTTGHPIEPYPTFEVGDLVTERFLGDGYPGVVVHVTPKTVYVARVTFQGNFARNDVPGYNGYGDSGTIAVDPESVEQAIAAGKSHGTKYVLKISRDARAGGSINDREKYGEDYHRSRWGLPNSTAGYLSHGARYRQDPHV